MQAGSVMEKLPPTGGGSGLLSDPGLRSGLLALRWLLIAAVLLLSVLNPLPARWGLSAVHLALMFAAYSLALNLAQWRLPWLAGRTLAAPMLDTAVTVTLMALCGSVQSPIAFLYPLVIVTLVLRLTALPALLATALVMAAGAAPAALRPASSWSADDAQLLGFEAALLLAVALPVALLARYLRSHEREVERQRQRTARLHHLNALMTATAGAELDLDRAVLAVAETARDAVGGDVGLALFGDPAATWPPVVWATMPLPPRFPEDGALAAARDLLNKRASLVEDAAAGPHHGLYEALGLRSWVAAPLTRAGEVEGALLVGSRLPGAYRAEAQEWLATLAAQASAPLNNARIHTRERAYAARVAALERVKSDFLFTASHELRTPLAAMKIAVGLLAERRSDTGDGPERTLLQSLGRNTDRLERLVEEILDMARLRSGSLALSPEPLDVAEVVRDAAAAVRPLVEAKRQRLEVRLADGRCPAVADRRRLDQVVTNLLINAHKYSPAHSLIRISAAPFNEGVLIRVEDEGAGVPDEERCRIFEAFYRVDGSQHSVGGIGLGLSIARGIVELHGGTIGVESASDRGSIFSVYLPQGRRAIEVDPHACLDC
ncbi:MAG: ATP-binding protein [Chloroflexi bacterium]|nr:ATP-binding protein [Chloroflexota bacterium]